MTSVGKLLEKLVTHCKSNEIAFFSTKDAFRHCGLTSTQPTDGRYLLTISSEPYDCNASQSNVLLPITGGSIHETVTTLSDRIVQRINNK